MNLPTDFNWGLIAPIIIIQFVLMITAWISLYKAEHTRGPKILWFFIILFGSMIGSIVYFIIGRKDAS